MARRQAAAYLIMGSLAATCVQCASDQSREQQAAIQPVPQTIPVEPSMTPAAGTAAPMTETAPPSAAEPQPAAAPARQPMTDEQIAAITDAANSAEIDQAKLAQKNAKNARVKKFAAMMITDHTQAKQKQKQLLGKLTVTPSSNPMSTKLDTESQQKLEELKALKGAEFDTAYIDAQVDAHQRVLDSLDNELIPDAKNAEFKALLGEIRPKVAAHLAEAKEIQQALLEAATGQPAKPGSPSGSKAKPEHSGHQH